MLTLIKGGSIVNEGKVVKADILLRDKYIEEIGNITASANIDKVVDVSGKYIFPGVIDDQVHFREPGLTHKGDIYTESKAAVAGGITSYMEMPNTSPQTLTQELLEEKYKLASTKSLANYSFYMGVSNDNLAEVLKTNPANVCGVKVFMGASTGNMLVDKRETLEGLFSKCKMLIAAHCEDETIIKANSEKAKQDFGEDVPIEQHPLIRSEEACYHSSSMAVELAKKYNTRLHILHISTEKELGLFSNNIPLKEKRITSEACIHHLWFSDADYKTKGAFIKWNPAVKKASDRDAILQGVLNNKIDVIATDHAPHTLDEKQNKYFKVPSGGPLVQHALVAMLELYHNKKITLEKIAEKMCHALADCFSIEKRGYIRKGYYADLAIVNLDAPWTVNKSNLLYKCGWSPFEGTTFKSKVTHTFVSGHLVFENDRFDEGVKGERLLFSRI